MPQEFDGAQYQRASTHQEEWGRRLIAELELRGTERVLDLGCGDGRLTARLAELVPAGLVVGIDSSAGMIATAMAHQLPNLRFRRQDILAVDEAGEYDVIFSNAALHWVHDHRRVLAVVHRALRPRGLARLNFAAAGNCAHLMVVLRQTMADDRFGRSFHGFDWPWFMPELEAYVELVGEMPFGAARVWGETDERHFPDAAAMVRWIDMPSLVPFLAHLPPGLRAPFRAAVIDGMLQRCRRADGSCVERFRRVNVLARR